ncbi:hypothetical protein [Absiella sp. AM29-15]|nr:hypothetical protein [Absiella sp. AM29-15]
MAILDLEEAVVGKTDEDKEMIKFFKQCFDRALFMIEYVKKENGRF